MSLETIQKPCGEHELIPREPLKRKQSNLAAQNHNLEPASYVSNVVLFCVFSSLLDLLLLQLTKMNGTEQKGLINKDGLVSST